MKKTITLLAFAIGFSINAQMDDNSANNNSAGTYAVAMGDQTVASGVYSTAMGRNTTASGGVSTAMGAATTASGSSSTAMGYQTEASGNRSTAMGFLTTASDYASVVIGQYNLLGSTVTNSSTGFSTENTAFVIGNGADADNRSDALTVLFDGTTNVAGSVTATSFIGDGSQLTNLPSSPFSLNTTSSTGIQSPTNTASGYYSTAMGRETTASGYYSTSTGLDTTASGASSTTMGAGTMASGYYSTAMGYLTTASGNYSTAMGDGTEASGTHSTAMGYNTTASGYDSTAMGYQTTASGDESTAMGDGTTASGYASTSMGLDTTASGPLSTAMGYQTTANGYASTAMGRSTTASEYYSTAMGYQTTASGVYSTAMGRNTTASGFASSAMGVYTTASGYASTAMGASTTASDRGSLVIGQHNLLGSTVTNSSTEFSTENTAFVIGNGAAADNRSDALTVLFDGTTTIAGDLSINSDARLKANIISLGSTLAKVLQIDGKSYTMKKDDNKKQKIGVLAQDIEKVFPELVSESNGVKSVNYQGLVPVLINALKEQQAEIDELKEMVQALVSSE